MLDDTTGYILQSGFTEGVAQQIKEKVLSLKSQGMKRRLQTFRHSCRKQKEIMLLTCF